MQSDSSLKNQLLIAMPGMLDPIFSTTVTLVCEHNVDGALVIVINRPMALKLGGLFEQLELSGADTGVAEQPGMSGGPVGMQRGYVFHGAGHSYESTLDVSNEIRLTLSRDIIDAMALGDGPDDTLVALGYAGWEAGQLEDEMLANSWLNVPATPEIVFDTPFGKRWDSAARTLGIDIASLPTDAGHA